MHCTDKKPNHKGQKIQLIHYFLFISMHKNCADKSENKKNNMKRLILNRIPLLVDKG
jgi:hypothetical protein